MPAYDLQVLFSCLHKICRFCSAVCTRSAGYVTASCTRSAGCVQLSAHDLQVLLQMPAYDLQVLFSCMHTICRFFSAACTRSAGSVQLFAHDLQVMLQLPAHDLQILFQLSVHDLQVMLQLPAHDLQFLFSCLHTICRFCSSCLHTICSFCSAVCTRSAGSVPAVCTRSAGSVQLSARNREHVLVVMPVFHPRARSILGSEVETGFINCSVSSYRCRIISDVLCFRATVPRSEQNEEQLRYTDAPFFVLRISPQRFVSPKILLPS